MTNNIRFKNHVLFKEPKGWFIYNHHVPGKGFDFLEHPRATKILHAGGNNEQAVRALASFRHRMKKKWAEHPRFSRFRFEALMPDFDILPTRRGPVITRLGMWPWERSKM